MILGYTSIAITILITLLVAFKLIKPKAYPVIYVVGLLLVWQTTLLGNYLVGSDIQSEYWIARHSLDGWDIGYPHLYNSSISTTVIAPALSRLLHIDLVAIFRIVYPMIFATVPIILYFIYKKFLSDERAFYAVIFFMIVPVYSMEIPQLPRQEIAEVVMAAVILAIIGKWKRPWKSLVIVFGVFLTLMLHWTIGLILICYIIGIAGVKLISKVVKWELIKETKHCIPVGILLIVILISLPFAYLYGKNVASGLPIKGIMNIVAVAESIPQHITEKPASVTSDGTILDNNISNNSSYLSRQEPLVQIAIGMDIAKVSWLGTIFRIVQIITQLMIIAGCILLLLRYKKYKIPMEFVSCIGISAILLIACIFVPNFSGLLGMTRFYHMALFFLAPMFVISADWHYALQKVRNKK